MSENVTEPIKATTQTSYFRIFVVTAVAGIPFLILMVWLANTVLPPADAEAFKKPLLTFWAGAMAFVGSAAGWATLKGALMRTEGKITAQVEQAKAAVTSAAAQPLQGVSQYREAALGVGQVIENAVHGGDMVEEIKAASQ